MLPGIQAPKQGYDDNVNESGEITGNDENANRDTTREVDQVICVKIFQWGNFDPEEESEEEQEEESEEEQEEESEEEREEESEEEHTEYEFVYPVTEAVDESDGPWLLVQLDGDEGIYQDANNNDNVGKVAIIDQYMSLDGGNIDDSDPDETGFVHVQQQPIEDRLMLRDVVSGLAVMNQKLYVAFRGSPFLDVYSIEMCSEYAKFVHERVIHVKQLIDPWDLEGGINNVLFVSESYDNFIHRIQLPKEIQTKWYVNGSRMTLSVHMSGNLFVSCSSDTIFEYTPTGGFVREIVINRRKSALWFDRQVCGLKHAVPLVDGTFFVCMNSRVCVVDKTGEIIQASEEEDHVNLPCYLAGSKYFTVVAGSYNGRLVRMDPLLEFWTTKVFPRICLERPRRVIWGDEGIVFVSEEGKNSITIHQFED